MKNLLKRVFGGGGAITAKRWDIVRGANLSCWHNCFELVSAGLLRYSLAMTTDSNSCFVQYFRLAAKKSLTETNHSPLTTHHSLKKVAFTLAEVLITLGIIGVVAALTLPTVIQNYRKQKTVAQLQKTYSTVNQALLQSIAENGDYSGFDKAADDIGDEAYFKKYWLPYFKGATICNERNRCGYGRMGTAASSFYFLNGTLAGGYGVSGNPLTITAIHYGRSTIMLPDGSVVIYFNGFGDNNQNRSNQVWIFIDVNGGKEPNAFGKDVFLFDRNDKGVIVPRCKNLTIEQVNSDCSKTGKGECCAQKIINDGWKINY